LPRCQYHHLCTQTDDLGSQSRRALQQWSLNLDAAKNEYTCLAEEALIWRFSSVEKGMKLHRYWSSEMPRLHVEIAVHTEQATTGSALAT
tara:strand:+ start:856 stop:1125 length:270 start_codon:yes stop_codon:yes gene_type:complete